MKQQPPSPLGKFLVADRKFHNKMFSTTLSVLCNDGNCILYYTDTICLNHFMYRCGTKVKNDGQMLLKSSLQESGA